MTYISKRERAQILIDKRIIPALEQRDLDKEKVIAFICTESYVPRHLAIELINTSISIGKMKEEDKEGIKILTISDNKFNDWIKDFVKEEKEITKILEINKNEKS